MFARIMDSLKRAFRNEKGQGMVEYILLVLLIAIVAFGAFQLLGQEVESKTNSAKDTLNTATGVVYMVR